jgi:hypothetical protein
MSSRRIAVCTGDTTTVMRNAHQEADMSNLERDDSNRRPLAARCFCCEGRLSWR